MFDNLQGMNKHRQCKTRCRIEKIMHTRTEEIRTTEAAIRGQWLPWTKVAEPRRKSGSGVVRVVEARVCFQIPSLGQALLQSQETPLLVVAETIPEIGPCQ